jgi:hypothetical protein
MRKTLRGLMAFAVVDGLIEVDPTANGQACAGEGYRRL